jgi:hypothetical protein
MQNNKVPESFTQVIDDLYDFLEEPEINVRELSIEAIRKELQDRKIDTKPLKFFVQQQLSAERLRIAHKKRLELLETKNVKKPSIDGGFNDIKKRLQEYLQGNPQIAVAYRNMEDTPDADIESLMEDLRLLEDLNNNDASR